MIHKILERKDKVKAIVAVNKHNVIGDGKQLLWFKPDDLKYFKYKTINDVVIMGSNTFMSLPIRPLKNRMNIVLTSDKEKIISSCTHNDGDLIIVNSIKELNEILIDDDIYKEVWVIGGSKIYEQLSKYCGELYLTTVLDNDISEGVKFPIEMYNIKKKVGTILYEKNPTLKTDIFNTF